MTRSVTLTGQIAHDTAEVLKLSHQLGRYVYRPGNEKDREGWKILFGLVVLATALWVMV